MAKAEYHDGIRERIVVVKREISGSAAGNYQLAQIIDRHVPEQRVLLEHRDCIRDELGCFDCGGRIFKQKEVDQPLQVADGCRRIDYARHRLGFGLVVFLPAALSLM